MSQRYLLIIYCIITFFISFIPIVGVPFNWLETIFHELSHAIVTLITGGEVISFKLELSGAGMVMSRGGISLLIAFSGYAGAAIWGFLLYQAGSSKTIVQYTLALLIATFIAVLVFWVRDLLTAIILLIVTGLLALIFKNTQGPYLSKICQFTGVLVLFNAIKSPLYLIDGQSRGDGALLASLSAIPEFIWVLIWLSLGLYLLYKMWQQSAVVRSIR